MGEDIEVSVYMQEFILNYHSVARTLLMSVAMCVWALQFHTQADKA
jgi:hypothetical protein